MLRPVRTVRVATKEELDAALAAADQITVEGDDELLTYAVNKAAGEPENRITVQLAKPAAAASSQRPSGSLSLVVVFAVAMVFVGGGLWWFFWSTAPAPPVASVAPPSPSTEPRQPPKCHRWAFLELSSGPICLQCYGR